MKKYFFIILLIVGFWIEHSIAQQPNQTPKKDLAKMLTMMASMIVLTNVPILLKESEWIRKVVLAIRMEMVFLTIKTNNLLHQPNVNQVIPTELVNAKKNC